MEEGSDGDRLKTSRQMGDSMVEEEPEECSEQKAVVNCVNAAKRSRK